MRHEHEPHHRGRQHKADDGAIPPDACFFFLPASSTLKSHGETFGTLSVHRFVNDLEPIIPHEFTQRAGCHATRVEVQIGLSSRKTDGNVTNTGLRAQRDGKSTRAAGACHSADFEASVVGGSDPYGTDVGHAIYQEYKSALNETSV